MVSKRAWVHQAAHHHLLLCLAAVYHCCRQLLCRCCFMSLLKLTGSFPDIKAPDNVAHARFSSSPPKQALKPSNCRIAVPRQHPACLGHDQHKGGCQETLPVQPQTCCSKSLASASAMALKLRCCTAAAQQRLPYYLLEASSCRQLPCPPDGYYAVEATAKVQACFGVARSAGSRSVGANTGQ
jgi:hypothetical protein